MRAPAVRMGVTGAAIPIDVTPPGDGPLPVRQARSRIAEALGKPLAWVRLLDPSAGAFLEDDAPASATIEVFIGVDPAAEEAAESRLLDVTPAGDMAQLALLKELELGSADLVSLPESFGRLTALHTLDLTSNRLTALPESFGDLAALHTLDLTSNELRSLPKAFGNLATLHTLDLTCNGLTALPETFGNLPALHTLDLTSNGFFTLPENFGNLAALHKLFLNGNGLAALPGASAASSPCKTSTSKPTGSPPSPRASATSPP